MKSRAGLLIWLGLLLMAMAVIYWPGLQNALVFDDRRLLEGRQIWQDYGGLPDLKQRLLSYGSFVWLEALVGEGWWKQRLFNLALHLGVVLVLYALLDRLSAAVNWPDAMRAREHFDASRKAALRVAVLFFACNPVAVYAVAYLIQRSILAATLFSLLSCLALVQGLGYGRRRWLLAGGALYLAAVLCKEHAIMLPGVWVALFIFLRRPPLRQLLPLSLGALAVLSLCGMALYARYGEIIGVPFDPLSRVYLQQLEALAPDIQERIWPLSMLNQAELFFRYGLLWVLPNPEWMSIDLRPAFPLGWLSLPEVAGALGFILLAVVSVRALLTARGPLAFAALCVLIPLILFVSEFMVVWVQDPFVLYRSYLWAIGLPGLLMILLIEWRPLPVYVGGLMVVAVMCAIGMERVDSLKSNLSVWSDAAEKVDMDAGPGAVGRWRPFLNRGAQYLEQGLPVPAMKDFDTALALGEVRGHALYMKGIAAQLLQRYAEAIEHFNAAEKKGVDDIGALYFNRAESRLALGRLDGVFEDLERASSMPMSEDQKLKVRTRLASIALGTGRYAVAKTEYRALLEIDPKSFDFRLGLGLASAAQGENDEAVRILTELSREGQHPAVHHGLAIAFRQLGRQQDALMHINAAIRLDPQSPHFQALRRELLSN